MSKGSVLQLINSYSWSGAELFASNLALSLDQIGYDAQVCSIAPIRNKKEEQLFNQLSSQGLGVTSLEKTPGKKSPQALYRLSRLLRNNDLDLIHTHCSSPDFYGRLASLFNPEVQSVVTFHGTQYKNVFPNKLLTFTTDTHIAVSEAVRSWAQKQFALTTEDIEVVYNGIDRSKFENITIEPQAKKSQLGVNTDNPVITSVGRLESCKGHRYLISALRVLKKRGVEIELLLVGDGDLAEELHHRVEKRGLSDSVHFLGVRMDVNEILAISDAFVMPSLWEGLGIAALEAMGVGVPVIASKVGGLVEIIDHGSTGFLVPPKDSVAIANFLEKLLKNPDMSEHMASQARSQVLKNFTIQESVKGYDKVYQSILKEV